MKYLPIVTFQCKKALATAKDEYDCHNKGLMEDMPKLYEGRIDYVTPSLQALIKSQVKNHAQGCNVKSVDIFISSECLFLMSKYILLSKVLCYFPAGMEAALGFEVQGSIWVKDCHGVNCCMGYESFLAFVILCFTLTAIISETAPATQIYVLL